MTSTTPNALPTPSDARDKREHVPTGPVVSLHGQVLNLDHLSSKDIEVLVGLQTDKGLIALETSRGEGRDVTEEETRCLRNW